MPANELAEDLLLDVGGNPDPLVVDADEHPPVLALALDLDDPAVGRVLDCVRKQIRDHLRKAVLVPADGERRLGQRHLEQVVRALAGEQLGLLAEDAPHVHQILRERQLPLVEPLRVEEVVDERREPASLRVDDAEVLAPFLGRDVAL